MLTHAPRGGRPTKLAAEVRAARILQAANQLFRERGFSGTSIEQIAASAQVGKHTIYRRFASKEILFVAVVRAEFKSLREKIDLGDEIDYPNPLDFLRSFVRGTLETVLDPWVVGLYRVAIAEAIRFPDLGAKLREDIIDDQIALLKQAVTNAQVSKQIIRADPSFIIRHLIMTVCGEAFVRALLGADDLRGGDELDAYFEMQWDAAMGGVLIRS